MTSLTADELLQWNDTTATKWRAFLEQAPEALTVACDVRGSETVADLLQHIVAAELRYAQQLSSEPISDYANIPKSTVAEIFQTHDLAMAKYRALNADNSIDWDEEIEVVTRSAGRLIAPRRAILFHGLLHGIRHYAQLATLLRRAGLSPDWQMDYLFMSARLAERRTR
jgi:uncharacterized damage-inducible protein DinB